MWTSSKKTDQIEARRRELLEKGFEIFSKNTIESIAMQDVAAAAGCGIATLYRYFGKKPGYVVAVATWKWEQFQEENKKRRQNADFEGMSAGEIFEFYLDSFLELYKKHQDLLRFNQFFNVYVRAENIDAGTLQPYQNMIQQLKKQFHEMYLKAEKDHTLRTDEPEEEMFCTTLHLMLAAVTRYAIGLVYIPGDGYDVVKELEKLKKAFILMYVDG